jgi:hypothetical protein
MQPKYRCVIWAPDHAGGEWLGFAVPRQNLATFSAAEQRVAVS